MRLFSFAMLLDQTHTRPLKDRDNSISQHKDNDHAEGKFHNRLAEIVRALLFIFTEDWLNLTALPFSRPIFKTAAHVNNFPAFAKTGLINILLAKTI